jgi:metal-responsive CopG/Arc/MetJ family transcriptional regulator
LLDAVNEEAKDEGTNRSAFIQTALEAYLQAKRKKREEEEQRRQMREASRRIDDLAKELGDWDPVTIIRRFRDTNLKGDR